MAKTAKLGLKLANLGIPRMLILSFLKRNERISVIKMIFSYENLNGKLKIGHF